MAQLAITLSAGGELIFEGTVGSGDDEQLVHVGVIEEAGD